MIVHTLWGVRKDSPDVPELIVAWDEYAVDGNPDGFQQDCEEGLASWGTDLAEHRYINLRVSLVDIEKAFGVPATDAGVES